MIRTLVAGVGNIFLGDDAFGVEVARRLEGEDLGADVRVADFGIRGVHLAYELLDGYDTLVLIDAAPRGGEPGTVYVIEPELADVPPAGAAIDGHGMEPAVVLGLLKTLGGDLRRAVVVGCEPASVEEGIGLSAPVAAAVDGAVDLVRNLVGPATPEEGIAC